MRVARLQYVLMLMIFLFVNVSFYKSVLASNGVWVRTDYDYKGIFQSLDGYEEWSFNRSRGPNDRWVINLTISGYGFNPTTVLVCNQLGYDHWKQTGSTTQCALAEVVIFTLDVAVNLTQQSNWFFVLNNSGAVTLFYTLFITHYQWSTEIPPTAQPDTFSFFGPFIIYLIILCIICFLIIPCLCNCSCIGRWRRGSRKKSEGSEIHHHYYLVRPPDAYPAHQIQDDEEDEW
ncbi:MAG: hypothetical protein ACFE8O_11085 [Candidatus Hermodarchaeota archaeon]